MRVRAFVYPVGLVPAQQVDERSVMAHVKAYMAGGVDDRRILRPAAIEDDNVSNTRFCQLDRGTHGKPATRSERAGTR